MRPSLMRPFLHAPFSSHTTHTHTHRNAVQLGCVFPLCRTNCRERAREAQRGAEHAPHVRGLLGHQGRAADGALQGGREHQPGAELRCWFVDTSGGAWDAEDGQHTARFKESTQIRRSCRVGQRSWRGVRVVRVVGGRGGTQDGTGGGGTRRDHTCHGSSRLEWRATMSGGQGSG